jgi:hypothetical protein
MNQLHHNDIVIYKKDGKVWLFDRYLTKRASRHYSTQEVYAVIKREGKILDRVEPSDLIKCLTKQSSHRVGQAIFPSKFAPAAKNPLAKLLTYNYQI